MTEKTVPTIQEDKDMTKQESTREKTRYVAPSVDIYEEKDKLVVIADIPGADKDSVSVDVEKGILTLQAHSKANGFDNPVYSEYEILNYHRQFELSEKVDVEKISAELKNGVLFLTLPKVEKAKPKQIEIKLN